MKMEAARMKVKRTRTKADLTHTALMRTTATQRIMRAILVTAIMTWKPNRRQRDVIK